MAAPYGLDQPDYAAPYAEAANQGRARMSTLQRIALALAGAGQGIQSLRPGVGPLGSALTGFSRGYILSNAAERAAQDYALKQQEAEDRKRSREIDDAYTTARREALAKEKPEKPTDPELAELNKELIRARIAATKAGAEARGRTNQPKPEKPKAPPRPREAVMRRIDLINQADVNNPEHRARLQQIIRNPATPQERDAALQRLEISPGFYRR